MFNSDNELSALVAVELENRLDFLLFIVNLDRKTVIRFDRVFSGMRAIEQAIAGNEAIDEYEFILMENFLAKLIIMPEGDLVMLRFNNSTLVPEALDSFPTEETFEVIRL